MILGIETSHQLGDLHLGGLDLLLGVDDRHGALDVGNVLLDPLERVLLGIGSVGGVRPGMPSSALLHAVPGVGVQQVLLVRRTIFPVVEQRGEGISLVVLTGPPEDHDDTKEAGEEKVPEGLVQPQVLPLGQAVYDLVVLDTPEHEDDAGNDGKGECVGEVFVKRELGLVAP